MMRHLRYLTADDHDNEAVVNPTIRHNSAYFATLSYAKKCRIIPKSMEGEFYLRFVEMSSQSSPRQAQSIKK